MLRARDGRVRRRARAAGRRVRLVLRVDGRHAKGEADVVRNVLLLLLRFARGRR